MPALKPQRAFQRREDIIAKTCKDDAIELLIAQDFAYCNFGRLIDRISVHPTTDGRERDRANCVVNRQLKAVAITRGQQFRFATVAATPYRTDRMDHMPGRQPIAAGDARLAGRTAADLAAFLQQLGPGGAVDRAIDAAAAEESGVGGVDDGVDIELGDIGFDDLDFQVLSAES